MAIGLGRMFGFHFLENFDPFIARSVREFWQRWHISLGTWFRDYLYTAGRQPGQRGTAYFNLLIVFFLTGLWHGASWNFVIGACCMGRPWCWSGSAWAGSFPLTPPHHPGLHPVHRADRLGVLPMPDLTKAWHFVLTMLGVLPGDSDLYFPDLYLSNATLLALCLGCWAR